LSYTDPFADFLSPVHGRPWRNSMLPDTGPASMMAGFDSVWCCIRLFLFLKLHF